MRHGTLQHETVTVCGHDMHVHGLQQLPVCTDPLSTCQLLCACIPPPRAGFIYRMSEVMPQTTSSVLPCQQITASHWAN